MTLPVDVSEVALLRAVRDAIVASGIVEEGLCDIEFDEQPPASVRDKYVMVLPGGWRPGPTHETSGGVIDRVFAVQVVVVIRAPEVPRDMSREIFLDALNGINSILSAIELNVVDFAYSINDAANAYILEKEGSTEGFIEPLRTNGPDPKPQMVGGEYFDDEPESRAGMKRSIMFSGARRIKTRS